MRSKTACCSKVGIKKGPWTPEEDQILTNYIKRQGEGRWRTLPENAGLLRCGKSCRLRWMNYLRPNVKRGQITPEEEQLILSLHRLLGNRWSSIAGRIPGRTDNEIKNYWNTHLSKKLISQGVDPRTHMPLEPDLSFSQTHSMGCTTMDHNGLNTNVNYPSPTPLGLDQIGIGGYYDITRDQYPAPAQVFYPNTIHEKNQIAMVSDQYNTNVQGSNENYYGNKEASTVTQASYENHYVNEEVSAGTEGSYENEEEDMLDYCIKDEAFSSFLNSLMNEDDLKSQQQLLTVTVGNTHDSSMIYGNGNRTQESYHLDSAWEEAMSPGIPSTSASVDQQQRWNLNISAK